MMMIEKFKKGDFLFHKFNLFQVQDVITDKYSPFSYHVTNGYIGTSAEAEDVFPLTINNKLISEEYQSFKDKLHELEGERNLNWTEISNWLENHWVVTMDRGNDIKFVTLRYTALKEFCEEITHKLEESQKTEVDGVTVLR